MSRRHVVFNNGYWICICLHIQLHSRAEKFQMFRPRFHPLKADWMKEITKTCISVKSQAEGVNPRHDIIQAAWLTALNLTPCGDTPATRNKRPHSLHTMVLVNESVMWFFSSHFTHLSTPPTDTDRNSCRLMVLRKQTTHRILLSSESHFSSSCERQIKLSLFLFATGGAIDTKWSCPTQQWDCGED